MSGKSVPELTEGQKDCLRLVANHHTSKEIARILAISPFTVDQRLDAARRKLSANSRKEAAKIFVSIEEMICEPLVYQSDRIEPTAIVDKNNTSPEPVVRIFSKLASVISVPPIGGERHELLTKEILVQSLNIAFFGTLVIAVLIIILSGMMRLLA